MKLPTRLEIIEMIVFYFLFILLEKKRNGFFFI